MLNFLLSEITSHCLKTPLFSSSCCRFYDSKWKVIDLQLLHVISLLNLSGVCIPAGSFEFDPVKGPIHFMKSKAFVLIFLASLHYIRSLNSEFTPTYGPGQADSFSTLGLGRQQGLLAKGRTPSLEQQRGPTPPLLWGLGHSLVFPHEAPGFCFYGPSSLSCLSSLCSWGKPCGCGGVKLSQIFDDLKHFKLFHELEMRKGISPGSSADLTDPISLQHPLY